MFTFDELRDEYAADWTKVMSPGGLFSIGKISREISGIVEPDAKARFVAVERLTDVPWFVTGIIITREAGSPPNFHAWLHNGDPMFDHEGLPRRTTHEPRGCPENPQCTWEQGCVDAYLHEGLVFHKNWCPEFIAYVLERYNGFGYRIYHHIKSPYAWGSTIVQQKGKYDRDSHFNPDEMDEQIGGMALLALLMTLHPNEIKFGGSS